MAIQDPGDNARKWNSNKTLPALPYEKLNSPIFVQYNLCANYSTIPYAQNIIIRISCISFHQKQTTLSKTNNSLS